MRSHDAGGGRREESPPVPPVREEAVAKDLTDGKAVRLEQSAGLFDRHHRWPGGPGGTYPEIPAAQARGGKVGICHSRTSRPEGVSPPGQHLAPKIRLGVADTPA